MELSKDWKLIMTDSKPRLVHARGCEIIKDWSVDGSLEIPKVRPNKHKICKACEYLVYTTIGAKDYVENARVYKKVFKDVPANLLKNLFVEKRAKCFVNGKRIYFSIKQDIFYIDFQFDDIHLYHGNYRVIKRERGEDFTKSGYHEHRLKARGPASMKDAIEHLTFYDYSSAEKVHKKERKKRVRMTLSEYDPELYGFKDV